MRISDWSSDVCSSDLLRHRVAIGLLVHQPQRRADRAAREDHAVFGAMGKRDHLLGAREDHVMVARDRASAQAGAADLALPARAGEAVAAALRTFGEEIGRAAGRGSVCEYV